MFDKETQNLEIAKFQKAQIEDKAFFETNIKSMLDQIDTNSIKDEQQAALIAHWATRYDNLDILCDLIFLFPIVVASTDHTGKALLHQAVLCGAHALAFVLGIFKSESRADTFTEGLTLVKESEGDEKNYQSLLRNTFFYACASGDYKVLEAVLKFKPELNEVDIRRETFPLHLAVLSGHIDSVRLLLEVGAKDLEGGKALRVAEQIGNNSIIELLKVAAKKTDAAVDHKPVEYSDDRLFKRQDLESQPTSACSFTPK